MKTIVFDSGPIISMAMTNLLWILEPLKKRFGGDFVITPFVKYEVIDRPLKSKRFKYGALQVQRLLEKGVFTLANPEGVKEETAVLMDAANKMFCSKKHCITILQKGEVEAIATAVALDADAVVVDERTTRTLLERPLQVQEILAKKTHTSISIDHDALRRWREHTYGTNVIRSTELASVAYDHGLFEDKQPSVSSSEFLDGLLWSLRLNGCSISSKEIARIPKLLTS